MEQFKNFNEFKYFYQNRTISENTYKNILDYTYKNNLKILTLNELNENYFNIVKYKIFNNENEYFTFFVNYNN